MKDKNSEEFRQLLNVYDMRIAGMKQAIRRKKKEIADSQEDINILRETLNTLKDHRQKVFVSCIESMDIERKPPRAKRAVLVWR